jgi:hypothetical protein
MRILFLRSMAEQQWVISTFADDVARGSPAWAAPRRFNARCKALVRQWRPQARALNAEIQASQRADLERALSPF